MSWTTVVIALLVLLCFVPAILRSFRRRTAERSGRMMVGTVSSTSQTGVYINNQPQLAVALQVKDAAGHTGSAVLKQVFPLNAMPQPGDSLSVVLNPKNPQEAFLADSTAMQRDDRTAEVMRAFNQVPAALRNNPPRVGDITAITPVGDGTDSYQVNVVTLGQPPSPIFCRQSFDEGHPYTTGDRVYVVTDSQTPPRNGYIMPPSFTHGEKLPNTGNRAELLLGEALLFAGAKATGTVTGAATEETVSEMYRSRDVHRWQLPMTIAPADGGTHYDGTVSIVTDTPERAAAVSSLGAKLPVRYDPYDKATFVIDAVALGWGDPKLFRERLKTLHLAEAENAAPAGLGVQK